jgi:hypothetical protein
LRIQVYLSIIVVLVASATTSAVEVTVSPARPGQGKIVSANWDAAAIAGCRRSKTVRFVAGQGISLIERDLISYEIGRTIEPRAKASAELVSGLTWVRKDFVLESPFARSAELCVFTNGRLLVSFNGQDISGYKRTYDRVRAYNGVYPANKFPKEHALHSRNGKPYHEYWQGGWERIPIPTRLLRKGTNTVIIHAKKGQSMKFLIEESLYPNRSAVSRDGGATWDYDHLSRTRNINGEYVIRLALQRHPTSGWVESEAVDLWLPLGDSAMPVPTEILNLEIKALQDKPFRTALALQARLGSTPVYDPKSWTSWEDPAKLARRNSLKGRGFRFLQWRARLKTSSNRSKTPVLKNVLVTASVLPEKTALTLLGGTCKIKQTPIIRSSYIFAHAKKSKRLELLKEQAGLKEIIKDKKRGVEQLLALAHFAKNTLGSNAKGQLGVDTPWDALLLWNNARGKDRLTDQMCTHRTIFFVQCATALGYTARPCLWSHSIAEAWVEDLGKWVAFEPSNKFYFEIDGQPASMLEVSKAWNGKITGKAKHKIFEVKSPENRGGPKSNKNLAWFSRFWIVPRNNFFDSPSPVENAHGRSSFKFDGYLRWQHAHKKPLPWFSLYTSRPGDINFTVNTVNIHLARSKTDFLIKVLVETDGTVAARLEARINGSAWQPVKPAFDWKMKGSTGALEVRSVNAFGIPGPTASASCDLKL